MPIQIIIDRFATDEDVAVVVTHAAKGCLIKQVTVQQAWEFEGECKC
jgi:ribosomal protein L18E